MALHAYHCSAVVEAETVDLRAHQPDSLVFLMRFSLSERPYLKAIRQKVIVEDMGCLVPVCTYMHRTAHLRAGTIPNTHTYTCAHTGTHAQAHTHKHTCIGTHRYRHARAHAHTHAHTGTHAQAHVDTCTLVHMRIHTHRYMHARMCARAHTPQTDPHLL